MFKVIRFYKNMPGYRRTIKRNLTLAEAQEHCHNPETNSDTATNVEAKRRTKKFGPWFDGYTQQ